MPSRQTLLKMRTSAASVSGMDKASLRCRQVTWSGPGAELFVVGRRASHTSLSEIKGKSLNGRCGISSFFFFFFLKGYAFVLWYNT